MPSLLEAYRGWAMAGQDIRRLLAQVTLFFSQEPRDFRDRRLIYGQ